MPAIMIVFNPPIAGKLSDLTQIPERVHIQNILAIAAIETLNIAVLLRLAGFDTSMANPVRTTKLPETTTDEFRPVIAANVPGKTPF